MQKALRKSDLAVQLGYTAIMLAITPPLLIYPSLFFIANFLKIPFELTELMSRWNLLLFISAIASIPAILVYNNQKNRFGTILALLSVLDLILFGIYQRFKSEYLFLLVLLLALSLLVFIVFKRHEINAWIYTLPIACSIIILSGLFFYTLFCVKLLLVFFLFLLLLVAILFMIKDNVELYRKLGLLNISKYLISVFPIWAPALSFVVVGIFAESFLQDLILFIIDYFFENTNVHLESMKSATLSSIESESILKRFFFEHYEIDKLTSENIAKASSISSSIAFTLRTIIGITSVIAKFILIFLAIRSFFYVFTRVCFSERKGLAATLCDSSQIQRAKNNYDVKRFPNQYLIDKGTNSVFYIVRTLSPFGRPGRFSLQQSLRSTISRIYHKAYAMREFLMGPDDHSVILTVANNQEFIEVNLKEDQHIAFSYKYFVGMSATIKLYTKISFRLTSMVFGGPLYCLAKGPGKIVFLSQANTVVHCQDCLTEGVPIYRMIAWDKEATFDIVSETRFLDLLFSGEYFKPKTVNMLIVDSDKKESRQNGMAKYLKKMLLPL